jgi:hypothetical protein
MGKLFLRNIKETVDTNTQITLFKNIAVENQQKEYDGQQNSTDEYHNNTDEQQNNTDEYYNNANEYHNILDKQQNITDKYHNDTDEQHNNTDEQPNDYSKKIVNEADKFAEDFSKLDDSKKWYLSTGKCVEIELFIFGKQCNPSQSMILDVEDNNYKIYVFTDVEIDEIKS